MAKFILKAFVMKTLTSMKEAGEVMQYALKYYEKNVLTEEDLAEVESWFGTEEDEESAEDTESNSEVIPERPEEEA